MAGPVLTDERPRTGRFATPDARRPEPAVVRAGGDPKTRSRVRTQWLVLAAALTVLAGLIVGWALTQAAERVDVVSVARPVSAGAVITIDDLTITPVAFDRPVQGLVPAMSMQRLVGRVATIDLRSGALLTVGMWADGTELLATERTVGAVLAAGRFPNGLAPGSMAMAIAIDDDAAGTALVRVLDAERSDNGDLVVTLAVDEAVAASVAQQAAVGALVLVGMPSASAGGTP